MIGLILEGHSNDEIAAALAIGPRTVEATCDVYSPAIPSTTGPRWQCLPSRKVGSTTWADDWSATRWASRAAGKPANDNPGRHGSVRLALDAWLQALFERGACGRSALRSPRSGSRCPARGSLRWRSDPRITGRWRVVKHHGRCFGRGCHPLRARNAGAAIAATRDPSSIGWKSRRVAVSHRPDRAWAGRPARGSRAGARRRRAGRTRRCPAALAR